MTQALLEKGTLAPGQSGLIPIGGPFRGFNNALPADQVTSDKLTQGSLNVILNSEDGKLIRRKGMDYSKGGDNLTEYAYVAAPPGQAFKGQEVMEHSGAQLNPALPATWRAMWVDEDESVATRGQVVWQDVAAPFYCVIGYSGAWSGAAGNRVPPVVAGVGTVIWPHLLGGRGRSAAERDRTCGGSRNSLEVSGRVFYPNLGRMESTSDSGAPLEWNKARLNGTGQTERCQPIGMCPPQWLPHFTIVGNRAGAPWANNDSFYYSVLFIYEGGEWGPPVQVRAPNDILTGVAANQIDMTGMANNPGGYGLVRLVIPGPNNAADAIQWNDIPLGDGRVRGRVLLRSPKLNGLTTQPDPKDLQVVAIIDNNTQTTYVDGGGLDVSLDTNIRVRTDHIWMPPARHIGQFDQRVAATYYRDIPFGLLISFRHNTNALVASALHNTQDVSFDATREAYVTVVVAAGVATTLHLDVCFPVAAANQTHRRTYALANTTLQQLVDKINSQRQTAAESNVDYRWHAQLVPGADGSALAATLSATGAWGDNPFTTTTGAPFDGFADIGAGVAIDGMRAMACSWPAVLKYTAHMTSTFKNFLAFTAGGPGEVANSARAWRAFNQLPVPPEAGDCAAPVLPNMDGGLVPCTKAICVIRNIRDGKTGVDEDYRVEVVDSARACISSRVASGPGFNLVLTNQGLLAYDRDTLRGIRVVNLTEDLYDPGEQTGELAYEIAQCMAATSADTDDDYFNVTVGEYLIVITYRSSASVTRPDRWLQMDFSAGMKQTGVDALIDPETGRPWGWSPPQQPLLSPADTPGQAVIGVSAVGLVRYNDGVTRWFGTRDRHGATNEGRVDEIMVGTTDIRGLGDSSNITNAAAYGKVFRPAGILYRGIVTEVRTKYKKAATGVTLRHSRNPKDAAPTWRTKGLASTGTKSYDQYPWKAPRIARTPAEAHQISWLDDGSSTRPEIWGAVVTATAVDLGI